MKDAGRCFAAGRQEEERVDFVLADIMMTAYRQEMANLVEEALNSPTYACLYKPLEMKELLRLVEEIQERKRDVKRET